MPASHCHLIEIKYEIYISSLGFVFSSPEPKAQASHCHSAPSVAHPSVRRPALTSTFLQPLKWIQRIGSKISTSSVEFVFFGPIGTSKMAALVSDWHGQFSISPLKPLNRIQGNLTGSKISTSPTKFMVFRVDRKTRWQPRSLICWGMFDFSSETPLTELKKLDRKEDLDGLNQVCVFRADPKYKMVVSASDWLRHFRLLLWGRWMEFNETWQEARSQCPLTSLCFRADLKNKMAALISDWLRHFRLLI